MFGAAGSTALIAGADWRGGYGDYLDISPGKKGREDGIGEVARQAVSGYIAAAVPTWLGRKHFLEAMGSLYDRVVVKAQGDVNTSHPESALPGLRVLARIERLHPSPERAGRTHEEYVQAVKRITSLRDDVILEFMPGNDAKLKRERFTKTIDGCGLEEEWLQRYGPNHIKKATALRMEPDYWHGRLTEGAIARTVYDPDGKRGRPAFAVNPGPERPQT